MKQKDWNGILTILEIQHRDSKGNILWEDKNINNLLHQEGERFLLMAAFTGGNNPNTVVPEYYYLGLDNRSVVTAEDTLDEPLTNTLIGEPSSGGYERQSISSSGIFSINLENDHYVATSPIVAFRAIAGDWGPVSNLFLSTTNDNSGTLISTAVLSNPISLASGETVTMRIGMRLRGCY